MPDYRMPRGGIELMVPLAGLREYQRGDLLTINESSFNPPIAGRYEVLEARRHGQSQVLMLALQSGEDAD